MARIKSIIKNDGKIDDFLFTEEDVKQIIERDFDYEA